MNQFQERKLVKNSIVFLIFIFSLISYSKEKKRSISGGRYFYCNLERTSNIESQISDFSKEFIFPAPQQKHEDYSFNLNLRKIKFDFTINYQGEANITITEGIGSEEKKSNKEFKIDNFLNSSINISEKIEFLKKDDGIITYNLGCHQ